MNEGNLDSNTDGSLRWGDRRLDDLCRKLPAFSSMLLCATETDVYDHFLHLLQSAILKSARSHGLSTAVFNLADKTSSNEQMLAIADTSDIVIAHSDDPTASDATVGFFAKSDAAVFLLVNQMPSEWEHLVDVCLEAANGKIVGHIANSDTRHEAPFEVLSQTGSSTVAETSKMRMAIVNPTPAVQRALDLGCGRQVRIAEARSVFDIGNASIALVLSPWNDTKALARIAELSSRVEVILGGPSSLRASDRSNGYRCGARLVLPPDAPPEEIAAAISRLLDRSAPQSKAYLLLEDEYDYLHSIIKEPMSWSRSQTTMMESCVVPLIGNYVARAKLGGKELGILIFPLPKTSDLESTGTGGDAFSKLRHSLRTRDLCFGFEGHLIIISDTASERLAQMPLVRRMKLLGEEADLTTMAWPLNPNNGEMEEARSVLRALIDQIDGISRSTKPRA
jgi:hypothetical protein